MKEKNKGGRPPAWKTPQELETRIEEYFKKCEEKNINPEWLELTVHLDVSKQTMWDYLNHKPKFSESLQKAKLRCEAGLVRGIQNGSIVPVGGIFNLKVNYGNIESQHINHTVSGKKEGETIKIKFGV